MNKEIQEKANWEALMREEEGRVNATTIWDYRKQDKVETFWISDVHLGHRQCDEKMLIDHLKMIKDRQMPFADLGDLIENATRDSIGAGVYEQNSIADAQMDRAIQLFEPVKGLLKVMYPGNHEIRTFAKSGVNLTRQMAKRLGVKYGGIGGFNLIKVGDQVYTVYASHGGSGATTVGGKFNAIKRLGETIDADVLIQGHVHDTLYHSRQMINVDKAGKREVRKQHLVVNGSYLDWWGSYAQIKAYPIGNKGNAKITFYGYKPLIEVSFV